MLVGGTRVPDVALVDVTTARTPVAPVARGALAAIGAGRVHAGRIG